MRNRSHDTYFETLAYESFVELAKGSKLIPVYKEIPCDLLTTTTVYEKLLQEFPKESFILESLGSVNNPTKAETLWWGRYSYLGFDPIVTYRGRKSTVEITHDGKTQVIELQQPVQDFLRNEMQDYTAARTGNMPAFIGGMVGYFGSSYEYRTTQPQEEFLNLPDWALIVPRFLVVIEHKRNRMQVIAYANSVNGKDNKLLHQAYENALAQIEHIIEIVRVPYEPNYSPSVQLSDDPIQAEVYDLEIFRTQAESLFHDNKLNYLRLLVPSQIKSDVSAHSFYRALRANSPSNNMYYINFNDFAILGASPEMLFRVENDEVYTRPVVYYHCKNEDNIPEEGEWLANYLIDANNRVVGLRYEVLKSLTQNDPEVVIHPRLEYEKGKLFSLAEIKGILTRDTDVFTVLSKLNPSETLIGLPLNSAIKVIQNIEKNNRSLFGGCIGFIAFDGTAEMCVCIESIVITNGNMYLEMPLNAGTSFNISDEMKNYTHKLSEIIKDARALYC